jgi:hypothetical protein
MLILEILIGMIMEVCVQQLKCIEIHFFSFLFFETKIILTTFKIQYFNLTIVTYNALTVLFNQ